MSSSFEGYRLSYVCRKNGVIKTISGYFEEDLKYLIEDASGDRTFVAVVKEQILKSGDVYRFVPVETLHGNLPESYEITGNGYAEVAHETRAADDCDEESGCILKLFN